MKKVFGTPNLHNRKTEKKNLKRGGEIDEVVKKTKRGGVRRTGVSINKKSETREPEAEGNPFLGKRSKQSKN